MACVRSSTICMASTRQTFITKLQICTNLLTKVIYVVICAKGVYMYLIYRSLFAFINYHVYSSRLTIYFKIEIIVKSKKIYFLRIYFLLKNVLFQPLVCETRGQLNVLCWVIILLSDRADLSHYLSLAKAKNVAVNLTMGQWDNCGLAPGEMLKKCSPGQRTAHRELLNKNKSLFKDTRLKRGCRQILTPYS